MAGPQPTRPRRLSALAQQARRIHTEARFTPASQVSKAVAPKVYLMYPSRGRYKASRLAVCTGITALGMMLPGFISGYTQPAVGYASFFVIVCLFTIPAFLTIPAILKTMPPEEDRAG